MCVYKLGVVLRLLLNGRVILPLCHLSSETSGETRDGRAGTRLILLGFYICSELYWPNLGKGGKAT